MNGRNRTNVRGYASVNSGRGRRSHDLDLHPTVDVTLNEALIGRDEDEIVCPRADYLEGWKQTVLRNSGAEDHTLVETTACRASQVDRRVDVTKGQSEPVVPGHHCFPDHVGEATHR